jgi:hypothetical protein
MLWLLCGAGARAGGWTSYVLDDSASQVLTPPTAMRWQDPLPRRASGTRLVGDAEVRVVLNTAPRVGRRARIYMLMPPLPQSTLGIEWRTGGLLLPGKLSGGQRQLVFEGVVPARASKTGCAWP